MTRVLIVTGEYPPMRGGIGDYTHLLAQTLCSEGVDVRVLCSTDEPAEPDDVPAEQIVTSWSWDAWSAILEAVERFKPDWLHIQYQRAMYDDKLGIHLLPWRLRLLRPHPRIAVTFHDLNPPYLFPKAGPVRTAALRCLALGCDTIVSTNVHDRLRLQYVRRYGRALICIPIGSSIPTQPPLGFDRAHWRTKLGVSSGDLLVGRFTCPWHLDVLIDALHLMVREGRQVHLLLIGRSLFDSVAPHMRIFATRVLDKVSTYGLHDRVHRTGYLSPAEVSGWLSACDLACLTYHSGVSLRHTTLVAAFAHGLPVVTNRPNARQPELEDGVHALLVPSDDPQALASALARLADDASLRARLSQAALQVAESHSWNEIARRHINLYCRSAQ